MNQLFAAYAQGKRAKEPSCRSGGICPVRNGQALCALYRRPLSENTSIKVSRPTEPSEESLDLGWELLSILPRTELKRIKDNVVIVHTHRPRRKKDDARLQCQANSDGAE